MRGAVPSLRNYRFLAGLGLRTLVAMMDRENLPLDLIRFCAAERIALLLLPPADGNKPPPVAAISRVLELLCDKAHLPAFICCETGGELTGTLVMCLRVLQRWSKESISNEYCRYVKDGKMSKDIENFVLSIFSPADVAWSAHSPSWLQPLAAPRIG